MEATARRSLKRVVQRLTAAIDAVRRSFTRRPVQSLDYDSLLRLSNASRLEAIQTINDLSSRVGSSRHRRSSRTSVSTSHKSRPRSSGKAQQGRGRDRSKRNSASARKQSTTSSHELRRHRISMVTTSSDSTMLGEVRPRRDWPTSQKPRVAYPLCHTHCYHVEAGRKKWWHFF